MSINRMDVLSKLMALESSRRKEILADSRREAYRKEGRLQFHLKWYTLLLLGLPIVGFFAGFGATAATHLIGSTSPDSNVVAIMVAVAIALAWPTIHDRALAWILSPYAEKRLSESEI